jgi:mannosyltransferase OCH1-like enzyme
MESWEKFLGDYNCIFWDYQKAKATGIPWILEAMEQGNLAFAADAVRLYALYTECGIYLDSDVQLLKSPNELLDRKYILGY